MLFRKRKLHLYGMNCLPRNYRLSVQSTRNLVRILVSHLIHPHMVRELISKLSRYLVQIKERDFGYVLCTSPIQTRLMIDRLELDMILDVQNGLGRM